MNIYTNFSLKLHKYVQFSSGGNTPFLTTISDVQFTKREPTSRLLHQPQLTHPQGQIHTETPLQFYPNMHENKPTVPELYETNRKLKVNYNFRGYSRLGQYVMTFIPHFHGRFWRSHYSTQNCVSHFPAVWNTVSSNPLYIPAHTSEKYSFWHEQIYLSLVGKE